MADRFAEPPSFDEYVVARGADLLRTAWLLVGDDRGAEELVRATLARSWPQWRHLSEVGAGSYDAELRRSLDGDLPAAAAARRGRDDGRTSLRPGPPASTRRRGPTCWARSPGCPAASGRRLVLWTFDGLS